MQKVSGSTHREVHDMIAAKRKEGSAATHRGLEKFSLSFTSCGIIQKHNVVSSSATQEEHYLSLFMST
jgi:hypothetical protein